MNPSKKEIMSKKKVGESKKDDNLKVKKTVRTSKKVLYIELDDEVTSIYDRLKQIRMKNVYLVVPKRAILFQSIVNLKILKRKAEDLGKNIYIITNDQNGIHLAAKIGLPVYDKIEGHEHPSLVSGKFKDEGGDITPLKASINSIGDDTPIKRKEKKFSISELIRKNQKSLFGKLKTGSKANAANAVKQPAKPKKKNKDDRGKLVLVAPNRHALVTLVVISVLILMVITYIALPGATIAVTPESNVIDTSVNVTLADIDKNRAELDTHPINMIPSYVITTRIEKAITYQATGKEFRGENARGKIRIINESGNEWPLIAETRFQNADGLVFRIKSPVTVPAAGGENPGSLEVEVVADERDAFDQIIGDRGNVKTGENFFIPGLSSANQERLYAEASSDFGSGETIVIKKISAEDLEAARNKMINELRGSVEAELQANVAERNSVQKTNLELLKSPQAFITSEPEVSIPPNLEGQKLESFEVKGTIVASGVAYNKDDLLGILKSELTIKKNPQKRLYQIEEDSLSYKVIETNESAGKVKITATLKGIEEYDISPDRQNGELLIKTIKEHVLNMDIDEAELWIQNLPQIDKVNIDSWPAWAPTMPGIPDNIKIVVQRS